MENEMADMHRKMCTMHIFLCTFWRNTLLLTKIKFY